MRKFIKNLLLISVLILSSAALFADDWYICFGSYDSKTDAEARTKTLNDNNIPSTMTEFVKLDGSKFYRVFFTERQKDQPMAEFIKKVLSSSPETKDIIDNNIWVTGISQTSYVASKVDPSKRILIIKDSDSGSPISDANVKIDNKWDVTTNREGKAELPNEITDGEHSIYVTKGNEYVPTTSTFYVTNGEISSAPQISIPKTVDYSRIKIVLDWGETPLDLDSHIFSNSYHVYYSNKNEGNLNLDRDDTDSYGPETITIHDPNSSDTYKYYIFNYSDGSNPSSDRLSNSGAQITVIFDNEYKGTFKIKPNQTGLWWHVFDVVNKNQLVIYDTVSNEL